MRAAQLKVNGEYARWRGGALDSPEHLVLLERHEKGWVTVRRDDGGRERIRAADLAGPFEVVHCQYEERKVEQQRLSELRLTWERFNAGEPCPGCGRPYRGSRFNLPGAAIRLLEAEQESGTLDPAPGTEADSLHARMAEELLTADCVEQTPSGLVVTQQGRRVLADHREDEAFMAGHRDCHAYRHRVDHGPVHCGRCCPSPPLSPEQLARVAVLLRSELPSPGPPRVSLS